MSKRIYKRGPHIRSLCALMKQLEAGKYIFCKHKPLHPGWVLSWPIQLARVYLRHGNLYYARKR